MPPSVGDVLLAIVSVVAGSLVAVVALGAGWRRRNWLAYVVAAGAAAFVVGLVGQRTFPSAEAVSRLGAAAARLSMPGPFDAGVTLPLVSVKITPLALGGILIAALGLSLVLLFETGAEPRPEPPRLNPLQDDDTV